MVARYVGAAWAGLKPAELVLDLTTLFSLGLILIFNQFVDRYFLVLIPYAAIVVAKRLEGALLSWRRAVTVCCILLLIGSSVWTREELAQDQAQWTLSERLRTDGISPTEIFSDWKWLFYWQFEDYVHAGHVTATSTYGDLFGQSWQGRKRDAADYWVVHDLTPPRGETWRVVDQTSYFSVYARGWKTFYAVRRDRGSRGPMPEGMHGQ
jgi:hypothetical protein